VRREIILIVLVLLCPSLVYALTGKGTENSPYLIQSLADFDEFAADPNYWDDYIQLNCDIDLAGRTYTTAVIAPDIDCLSYFNFEGIPFTGVFDGADHRIINLTIDTSGIPNDFLGLFGMISSQQAHVKKLRLENVSITGADFNMDLDNSVNFGALCGELHDATISDCYVSGSLSKASGAGGLCGENFQGSIANCFANVSVTGFGTSGGLCGINWSGTIINCHAEGQVTSDYAVLMGGLCGHNYLYGVINNSSASGAVIGGQSSLSIGGLCGGNESYSIINGCYATGSVTGGMYSHGLGGLSGGNGSNCTISNSYAAGSVESGDSSGNIGGLCGGNSGVIINCYAVGFITCGDDSYSLGGLCGYQSNDTSEMINCFWDVETSNMTIGFNLNPYQPGSIINVLGLTTAQMQDPNTFISSSWDFVGEDTNGTNDYWRMCVDGIDYPRMSWEYSINGDFACPDGVGTDDLLSVSNNWLNSEELDPGFNYPCDPTFDGVTNLADYVVLAENWLEEN